MPVTVCYKPAIPVSGYLHPKKLEEAVMSPKNESIWRRVIHETFARGAGLILVPFHGTWFPARLQDVGQQPQQIRIANVQRDPSAKRAIATREMRAAQRSLADWTSRR